MSMKVTVIYTHNLTMTIVPTAKIVLPLKLKEVTFAVDDGRT